MHEWCVCVCVCVCVCLCMGVCVWFTFGGRNGDVVHRCGSGWRAGCAECRLHGQLDGDVAKGAVGMGGHVTMGDQLVAITEVPDVVHSVCRLQVVTRVVDIHLEDHVGAAHKHILLCDIYSQLLGQVHCDRNLIYTHTHTHTHRQRDRGEQEATAILKL